MNAYLHTYHGEITTFAVCSCGDNIRVRTFKHGQGAYAVCLACGLEGVTHEGDGCVDRALNDARSGTVYNEVQLADINSHDEREAGREVAHEDHMMARPHRY